MSLNSKFTKLLAGLVLITSMGVTSYTTTANAQSRQEVAVGERYYDHASSSWKIKKRSTGVSRRSNKSPIKRRKVRFASDYPTGTIIINTAERRLYLVTSEGRAIKYGIGVGRSGFTWNGTHRVTRKAEWPGWTPPATMRAREAKKGKILPRYMKGGPDNPLGARALYIGSTIYRIHGTSEPWTIGGAVSSGCIRLANEDIIDLYGRVPVGAKIIVK